MPEIEDPNYYYDYINYGFDKNPEIFRAVSDNDRNDNERINNQYFN